MLSGFSPNVSKTYGRPLEKLEDFFADNRLSPQVIDIDPCRQTTLVGKEGTHVSIPPYSLIDFSGHLVTEVVQVHLIEIFSKREIVLSQTFTSSEDKLLDMGGQVFLQASHKKLPLRLIKPWLIDVPLRSGVRNPVSMRLFQGSTGMTRTFSESPLFDWISAEKKKLPIRKMNGSKFYRFYLLDFQWVACGAFQSKRHHQSMVTAKYVNAMGPLQDSMAILSLDDRRSVLRMHASGHRFTSFNLPLKEPAHLLILGLIDGQLFAGLKHIPRLSNKLERVEMEAVDESDLLIYFYELDKKSSYGY
jgi:hypothetical protein